MATCGLGCVSIERSLAQVGMAKKVFAKPPSTKSKAAKIHAVEKVAKAKPTSSAGKKLGYDFNWRSAGEPAGSQSALPNVLNLVMTTENFATADLGPVTAGGKVHAMLTVRSNRPGSHAETFASIARASRVMREIHHAQRNFVHANSCFIGVFRMAPPLLINFRNES